MKKIKLNNMLYNVVSAADYEKSPDIYTPRLTAIEDPVNQVVLPIRTKNSDPSDIGVLYQPGAMCHYVNKPVNADEYNTSNVIDFTNPADIEEVFQKNQLIRDIQQDIMATPENVLMLPLSDEDTPEMDALKRAVNAKCIDKRMYEDRFPQYQNDMRLLKSHSITLSKMRSICDALDISVSITLKDKTGDIPNPMHTEFSVDITDGGTNRL